MFLKTSLWVVIIVFCMKCVGYPDILGRECVVDQNTDHLAIGINISVSSEWVLRSGFFAYYLSDPYLPADCANRLNYNKESCLKQEKTITEMQKVQRDRHCRVKFSCFWLWWSK